MIKNQNILLQFIIFLSIFHSHIIRAKQVEVENKGQIFLLFKNNIDQYIRPLITKKIKYSLVMDQQDKEEAHVLFNHLNNHFTIHIGRYSSFDKLEGEGLLALICHEYGHAALGSIHKKDEPLSGGVASEEEADYWAASTCLPKLLKAFPNLVSKSPTSLDTQFKKICQSNRNEMDLDICIRSLRGAYIFRKDDNKRCNSQELYLESTLTKLDQTPIIEGRPPATTQCSFNIFVAGIFKRPQPQCINLIMDFTNIIGDNCSKIKENESIFNGNRNQIKEGIEINSSTSDSQSSTQK